MKFFRDTATGAPSCWWGGRVELDEGLEEAMMTLKRWV